LSTTIFEAHEIGHHPLQHLSRRLAGDEIGAAAGQEFPGAGGQLHPLPQLEGVVVGDHDLRPADVVEHVGRHELAGGVVVVGVVGLEHPKPVADREAGGDDEKATGEIPAAWPPHGIDCLPGDEHRHHGRLPGPGGELEGEPGEAGVGLGIGRGQVVEHLAAGGRVRGHFGEPDRRLDRFDLAEERPRSREIMVPPVGEKPGGLGRHAPLGPIGFGSPAAHEAADLVDERHQFVVAVGGGAVEAEVGLAVGGRLAPLPFCRLRDRRNEFGAAAALDHPLRGLAVVQLPVPPRALVRGVDDGTGEEGVGHRSRLAPERRAA
jgi:hypothetical protein